MTRVSDNTDRDDGTVHPEVRPHDISEPAPDLLKIPYNLHATSILSRAVSTTLAASITNVETITVEALIYIANFIYLYSYLVRDMLQLRMLTIVAAICLVTYFYCRDEPLMTVVYWNLVFVSLNAVQLVRLLLERRKSSRGSGKRRGLTGWFGAWPRTGRQYP